MSRLMEKNHGNAKFSFFDGPITANNPMGVHHAWGRTYKDVVQRYKTMQGFDQRYQNGFDTQGLWVEVEVEKSLGLKSKRDVESFGVANFAQSCKDRVERFSLKQMEQSKRLGQSMDWENSYYTHTDENISAIWYFLKVCHENGWLYKGKMPMPWCWRCGTSLSAHEQSDSYKEVTHLAPYVKLRVKGEEFSLLVWTTTPWTLPANQAVAVHPDLDYGLFEGTNGEKLLARTSLSSSLLKNWKMSKTFKGSSLEGLRYYSPFPELSVQTKDSLPVLLWDEVSKEEGTGLVHLAPGCGLEDFNFTKDMELDVLSPLDEAGRYVSGYDKFSSMFYSEANELVLSDLDAKGLLLSSENYQHRYPHCWRCDEELVFRVVDEWFLSCEELRKPMLSAADQVEWTPAHVGKLFKDWLRNMGDWCVSRKRYWGLPLPFYECSCGHLTVVGSKEELLENAFGDTSKIKELHRPWVDFLKVQCQECGNPTERVKEVGDCWLDAGAMPFSTVYYFTDPQYWKEWFPADFVCEMREQVRLWFYATMFMSVTLTGEAPYRRVLAYEKVHDKHGKPMHKSKGNAVWFDDAVELMGADTLRLMYLAQNPKYNLKFDLNRAQSYSRPLLLYWNVLKFFVNLADLDNFEFTNPKELSLLDRWLLSELDELKMSLVTYFEELNFQKLHVSLEKFLDKLSSWYVRRKRRVLWSETSSESKQNSMATLFLVLFDLSKLLAPVTPFFSELAFQVLSKYQSLSNEVSVHLCDYPMPQGTYDEKLSKDVTLLRKLVSMGLKLRSKNRLRVRQPLSRMVFLDSDSHVKSLVSQFQEHFLDELNLKEILFTDDMGEFVDFSVNLNYQVMGPKKGSDLVKFKSALTQVSQDELQEKYLALNGNSLELEGLGPLTKDEYYFQLQAKTGYALLKENFVTMVLDLTVGSDLMEEGMVRDFVRHVQMARKELNTNLTTKVAITLNAPSMVWDVLKKHRRFVWKETQTTKWKNLNQTYFDKDDPDVRSLNLSNGNGDQQVLFMLKEEG